MTSPRHRRVAEILARLGESLGFVSLLEARLDTSQYKAIHDVAWLLPLEEESARAPCIEELAVEHRGRMLLPIVVFEVTGVDASSKTLIAELGLSWRSGAGLAVIVAPDIPFDRDRKSTGMHYERAKRVARLYSLLHPARAVGVASHAAVLSHEELHLPPSEPRVVVEREYTPYLRCREHRQEDD